MRSEEVCLLKMESIDPITQQIYPAGIRLYQFFNSMFFKCVELGASLIIVNHGDWIKLRPGLKAIPNYFIWEILPVPAMHQAIDPGKLTPQQYLIHFISI